MTEPLWRPRSIGLDPAVPSARPARTAARHVVERHGAELPRTLDEALDALAALPRGAALLAGGTDLMVELESGRREIEAAVNIWRVEELRGIAAEGDGLRVCIVLPAGTTDVDDAASPG